jgi:predicted negative regulator of RcsB-dependent stress response
MASYTEQEEVEKLKSWWKSYGNSLIAGIVVGVALLVGQKYWNSYREGQYAAASDLYREMMQQIQQKDIDGARKNSNALVDGYSGTPYASLAGLVIGRFEMEAGRIADAQRALEKAVRYAQDSATEHGARLNLSRVLAAQGKTEEALSLLAVSDTSGFESQYAELRGDLLRQQGKPHEALSAYETALKQVPVGSAYGQLLSMKRDSVVTERSK